MTDQRESGDRLASMVAFDAALLAAQSALTAMQGCARRGNTGETVEECLVEVRPLVTRFFEAVAVLEQRAIEIGEDSRQPFETPFIYLRRMQSAAFVNAYNLTRGTHRMSPGRRTPSGKTCC